MNCKRYQKWIERAALNSLDASQEAALDAHLAECDGCRESLETEQRLLAAINLGLTASVTGRPSPDFAVQVRMRLAAEGERARLREEWFHSRWIAAPVAGLLVALVVAIWFVRPAPQPARPVAHAIAPSTPASRVAPSFGEPAGAVVRSASIPKHAKSSRIAARQAGTVERPATARNQPQLQVLVEPGQWRAIVAVYRAAQSGRVAASARGQTSDQDGQPTQMKPIEIKPVVVAELYPSKPTEPAHH